MEYKRLLKLATARALLNVQIAKPGKDKSERGAKRYQKALAELKELQNASKALKAVQDEQ